MEIFKVENLSFKYPRSASFALKDVNLSVKSGEFLVICGKSGCGKTTLLRLLKKQLSPFGEKDGKIFYISRPIEDVDDRESAEKIGFVLQNIETQAVTDKVWHELAFGLESLGEKEEIIRNRVAETASFFGIQNYFRKSVNSLSGGQKQILNLASVMVMRPDVLILDEPTSQLDPISAEEFLKTLKKINLELGTTVILSEHRLETAIPLCDRVAVMESGKIIEEGNASKVCKKLKASGNDMYKAFPSTMRIYSEVDGTGEKFPESVKEARMWLEDYAENNTLHPDFIPCDEEEKNDGKDEETAVEMKDVHFRYEKNDRDITDGLCMSVKKGELFAILGGNGAGKTTALSLVCALNKPYRGKIKIFGKNIEKIENLYDIVCALPQNPQNLFLKNTVFSDLMSALDGIKEEREKKEARVFEALRLCRIEDKKDSHPYDLSGGEMQRAALAKVLLRNPKILLLDEPTKGLDAHFKECFSQILKNLCEKGTCVIMVSHDVEFCAKYADRCAMFFDGRLVSTSSTREFFKNNLFYTTLAVRMARTTIKEAVVDEDIILACAKAKENKEDFSSFEKKEKDKDFPHVEKENKEISKDIKEKETQSLKGIAKKSKGSSLISFLLLLVVIPITVFFGVHFLNDRKYFFISVLIILETVFAFVLSFEKRKPLAREIVIIAVLCAIAVAGRAAFFMLPQFKPVSAIVIISGVCLGCESGFLVGAMTGFVSNFFFGQGPWTPWQMFAFGIIGFLSGLLFKCKILKRERIPLCIFGFLAVFALYGVIMNTSSVIMYQSNPNFKMILSSVYVGIPFDLIHALSTVFFLWLFAKPMIEKLERVKEKYGLL